MLNWLTGQKCIPNWASCP